jgi:hypothetical protein
VNPNKDLLDAFMNMALLGTPCWHVVAARLARYLIALGVCFAPRKLLLSSGDEFQVEV